MAEPTGAYNNPLPVDLSTLAPANPADPDVWVEGDHPTDNPDGVTVSNDDYYPKTQEEKAALLGVEMVTVVDIEPTEPYPEGEPPTEEDADEMKERLHTPQERVAGEDWDQQQADNLAAGGTAFYRE